MPIPVVAGASLVCTFSAGAPTTFVPTPMPKPVLFEGKPVGVITDTTPANIPPFPTCMSPSNPTGMAKPVPTPGVCVPAVPAPWTPMSPLKLVGNKPILLNTAMCMCVAFQGVITVTNPGAMKEQVS